MSASISASDPILRNLANTLNASNPAELNDIVWLINQSPTLVSQLLAIQTANSNVSVTFSAAGSAGTTAGGPALDVLTPAQAGDGTVVAQGGSDASGQQQEGVTPAGQIVGDLSRAAYRWLDGSMSSLDAGNFALYSTERDLATRFSDQAKQLLNNFIVKDQIEGSEAGYGYRSGMANGYIWFDDGAGPLASSIALQQIDVSWVEGFGNYQTAESFLVSQIWNTTEGQSIIASTLNQAQTSSGPTDALGVDWSHLSNIVVNVDANGNLVSSTITTNTPGLMPTEGIHNYQTNYTDANHEITYVSDANYNLIATVSLDTSTRTNLGADTEVVTTNNYFVTQTANVIETLNGNNNQVQISSPAPATVSGNNNFIFVHGSATFAINGSGNYANIYSPTQQTVHVALSGSNNMLAFGDAPPRQTASSASAATVTGNASGTTLFVGVGDLNFGAGSGTLVLGSGNATVSGGAAGETLAVFGGSGSILYNGQNESANVIGGNADTIHAGAGGGWYQGGSRGHNLLIASNSGAGTVLQGSGSGDTLTGGAAGGTYLLAGAGNETLNGGNSSGEALFFLGSGQDVVDLGTGYSIVDGGSGTATIVGAGSGEVYGGTGGADLYTSTSGETAVNGFRVGTDHIGGSGTAVVQGANTLVTLSNGAKIELVGVAGTSHLFG